MNLKLILIGIIILVVIGGIVLYMYVWGGGEKREEKPATLENIIENVPKTIGVTSSAFSQGNNIPKQYTCDGKNIPIPIHVSNIPNKAVSLVLIMFDPDAPGGTFIHWILFNIPASTTDISEKSGIKGRNDFGRLGYGGPCPPPGSTHRYFIRVFALDKQLNLNEGIGLSKLLNEMKGHVIAYGELMGKYGRS